MSDGNFWADAPTMVLRAQQPVKAVPQIELDTGSYSDVTIGRRTVVKRDRNVLPRDIAERRAQEVDQYARELARENIPISCLISTPKAVPVGNGYVVEHEVELIGGWSLHQVEAQQTVARWDIVENIVRMVNSMSTLPGQPDALRIGIDVALRNWRIHPDTGDLIMIDLYPPLLRDANGSLSRSSNREAQTYFDRMCGTKSGAIAHVLLSAYQFPSELADQPDAAAAFVDQFEAIIPRHMRDRIVAAVEEYQAVVVRDGLGSAALGAANLPRLR